MLKDKAKEPRFVAICMLGMVLFNFPVLALFNIPGTLFGLFNNIAEPMLTRTLVAKTREAISKNAGSTDDARHDQVRDAR